MSRLDIVQILSEKIKKNQNANFYIVQNINDTLNNLFEIIRLSEDLQKLPIDHYDLLTLEAQSSKLVMTDLGDLDSFINSRPMNLKNKYIIINDSSKLTDAICNKLLKSLEEPPNYIIFFLIHSQSEPLLETIRSRGVEIFFNTGSPQNPSHQFQEFQSILNSTDSESEKIMEFKKKLGLKNFLRCSAALIENKPIHVSNEFINICKDVQQSAIFNNNCQWAYAKTLKLFN